MSFCGTVLKSERGKQGCHSERSFAAGFQTHQGPHPSRRFRAEPVVGGGSLAPRDEAEGFVTAAGWGS